MNADLLAAGINPPNPQGSGDKYSGKHTSSNKGQYMREQIKQQCLLNGNIQAMLDLLGDCSNIIACFQAGTGIEILADGTINWTGPDVSLNGITLVDGILTGTDDSGEAYPVNLISQDAGNLITYGSDGALIIDCAAIAACFDPVICEVTNIELEVDADACTAKLILTEECDGVAQETETPAIPLPDCDNTVVDLNWAQDPDTGEITVERLDEEGNVVGDYAFTPASGDDCCPTVSAGEGVSVTPTGPASSTDYEVAIDLCDIPAVVPDDIECSWSIPYCAGGNNVRASVNAFATADEDGRTANPLCDKYVYHRTIHIDNIHANSVATPGGKNVIVANQDSSQVSGDLVDITTMHRITVLSGALLTGLGNNSVTSGFRNFSNSPQSFVTGEDNNVLGKDHLVAGDTNTLDATTLQCLVVGLLNVVAGRYHLIGGRFNAISGNGNTVSATSSIVETSWNAVFGATHSVTTTGGGGNANVVGGDNNILVSTGASAVFGTQNQVLGDFNGLGAVVDSIIYGRTNIVNQDVRYSHIGGTDNVVGDSVTTVLNVIVNGARNVVTGSGSIVNGIDHQVHALRAYHFGADIKTYAGSINALGFGADHEMGDITPGGNQIALGNYIRVNGNNAHAIGDGLETAGLRLTNNQEDSFVCGYNTMDFGIYVDDGGPNGFSQASTSGGAGSGGRVNRFGINARARHFGAPAGNRSVFNIQYLPTSNAGLLPGDVYSDNGDLKIA